MSVSRFQNNSCHKLLRSEWQTTGSICSPFVWLQRRWSSGRLGSAQRGPGLLPLSLPLLGPVPLETRPSSHGEEHEHRRVMPTNPTGKFHGLKSGAESHSPPDTRPRQVTWTGPRLMGQGCLPLPWRRRESTEQVAGCALGVSS